MSYATNNASRGMEAIQKVIHRFCAEKMGEQSAWELIGEIYNAVDKLDETHGKANALRDEIRCLEMELNEKKAELGKVASAEQSAKQDLDFWIAR